MSMTDEITQAVFARDEVARYIEGSHGLRGDEARARVEGCWTCTDCTYSHCG